MFCGLNKIWVLTIRVGYHSLTIFVNYMVVGSHIYTTTKNMGHSFMFTFFGLTTTPLLVRTTRGIRGLVGTFALTTFKGKVYPYRYHTGGTQLQEWVSQGPGHARSTTMYRGERVKHGNIFKLTQQGKGMITWVLRLRFGQQVIYRRPNEVIMGVGTHYHQFHRCYFTFIYGCPIRTYNERNDTRQHTRGVCTLGLFTYLTGNNTTTWGP